MPKLPGREGAGQEASSAHPLSRSSTHTPRAVQVSLLESAGDPAGKSLQGLGCSSVNIQRPGCRCQRASLNLQHRTFQAPACADLPAFPWREGGALGSEGGDSTSPPRVSVLPCPCPAAWPCPLGLPSPRLLGWKIKRLDGIFPEPPNSDAAQFSAAPLMIHFSRSCSDGCICHVSSQVTLWDSRQEVSVCSPLRGPGAGTCREVAWRELFLAGQVGAREPGGQGPEQRWCGLPC